MDEWPMMADGCVVVMVRVDVDGGITLYIGLRPYAMLYCPYRA
jgi:hypothetical protein